MNHQHHSSAHAITLSSSENLRKTPQIKTHSYNSVCWQNYDLGLPTIYNAALLPKA